MCQSELQHEKNHNLLHFNFYCSVFNFREATTFFIYTFGADSQTQFDHLVHLGCDFFSIL
jgi:hypothetical protein